MWLKKRKDILRSLVISDPRGVSPQLQKGKSFSLEGERTFDLDRIFFSTRKAFKCHSATCSIGRSSSESSSVNPGCCVGVRRASKESLSWAKDKLVSFHIPMSSLGWFYARDSVLTIS